MKTVLKSFVNLMLQLFSWCKSVFKRWSTYLVQKCCSKDEDFGINAILIHEMTLRTLLNFAVDWKHEILMELLSTSIWMLVDQVCCAWVAFWFPFVLSLRLQLGLVFGRAPNRVDDIRLARWEFWWRCQYLRLWFFLQCLFVAWCKWAR